ncbi:MAG: protein kinase, partial [Deltaproteobacteria bacterium]|nr:protein kinase [Deltaproteobacteria bacterium]
DRPVAIKVLPGALARDAGRRERLIREARAQARVAHPHVGHIYFIGEDAGRLYFAMEYVAGVTLGDRVAAGPMPVDEALAAVRATALGLREAQRSGTIHRDVKPSNLMLDGNGVLKVLDFGLAASAPVNAAGEAGEGGAVAQTSLAGTPLYMAPEQARGEAVDFRADVYALGATLYHLVSGRPPFEAPSLDQLITLHASASRPQLPRRAAPRTRIGAIDALCARMMAARPADRFDSYDELLRALEIVSLSYTRPAGFWARCIAQFMDFVIVLLAIGFPGVAIASRFDRDLAVLPATLPVLALYHVVFTRRWGRSIGKALLELEVVDVATAKLPTLRAMVRRSLALFALPIACAGIGLVDDLFDVHVLSVISQAGIALWMFGALGSLTWGTARGAGRRSAWDRISRTMVRYRTAPTPTI